MIVRVTRRRRRGISLLEVLTALAIFMLSIVVISQMVDSGARTADRSRRITQAGIICEAKMAEIAAGIQPLQSVDGQAVDEMDGWQYSVVCEPQDWTSVQVNGQSVTGLNLVHVTVKWGNELEHTLSRVVMDPQLRVPAADPTPSSSSSGGGGSGSGGSGGSKSGGGGKSGGGTSAGGNKSGGGATGGGATGGGPIGGGTTGGGAPTTGGSSRPPTSGTTGRPGGG